MWLLVRGSPSSAEKLAYLFSRSVILLRGSLELYDKRSKVLLCSLDAGIVTV